MLLVKQKGEKPKLNRWKIIHAKKMGSLAVLAVLSVFFSFSVSAAEGLKSNYRGEVKLLGFEDTSYDWGHTVIQNGNKFQMWWVHGAPHDLIYYAESTDGMSWSKVQQVMGPARDVEDIKSGRADDSDWELMHVGSPTVVFVNNTYYMFYEAPKTVDRTTFVEVHNNIFMATSKDGITWNKYPSNDKPKPVIQMPAELLDPANGKYGVGQSKVLYRNGQFEIFYTADLVGNNGIYTASSKDGITWKSRSGATDPRQHDRLLDGNTLDVKYSEDLGQYVMAFMRSNRMIKNVNMKERFNYKLFYTSSKDRYNWGADSVFDFTDEENSVLPSEGTPQTRAFPGFVTNAAGIVKGKTFHIMFMAGDIHSQNADWRQKAQTWDGCLVSFHPREFASSGIQSPAETYHISAGGQVSAVSRPPAGSTSSGPADSYPAQVSSVVSNDVSSGTASSASEASTASLQSELPISSPSDSSSAVAAGAEDKKGGSILLPVMIVLVVVLLATGGAAMVLYLKKKERR